MSLDRIFAPSAAAATLRLVDGQEHQGHLSRFSPTLPDITMTLPMGFSARSAFPAERILFVGFKKSPGEPPAPPSARRGTLKVHLVGGTIFIVDPSEPETPGAVGFYARPSDPGSPFREVFFYNHGVNLKELNQPLGEMLVRDGRIGNGALQKGLTAQKDQKRTPIGQILVDSRKLDQASLEEATSLQKRKGTRIGEVLIEAGLATPQDIETALAEQRKRGGKRLGQLLVEMKLVSEVDLSATLAKKFQLPFVDLDTCEINMGALEELPREYIEKHRMLPVDSDPRSLTVAMADPLAVDALDGARAHTKKRICEVIVTPSQLERYVPIYLDKLKAATTENEMDVILKRLAVDDAQAGAEVETAEVAQIKDTDNSIIKLANQIIMDAFRRGASDIHIEPNGKEVTTKVRFRIDGDCIAYQEIPAAYRLPLVARIKIMAQLDISERRKPQDGKIRFRIADRQIELRVATIPTVNQNEDVVMRILAASKPLPLDRIGLSDRNLSELRKVISKPYGLVLCVGPTGSGKTTTLHSALGHINVVDTKIWTAEDPVEITQAGLRQVQVNSKIGFTFAAAMRAFLRADPDVIMVGEMRDEETANTAVEASLTGHLVLSTLHTNSAPETVTRLIDMGLDPFSFADALLGILAQRLARTLCVQCREQYTPEAPELEELAEAYGAEAFSKLLEERYAYGVKLWRAKGCSACSQTGYKGRLGVHELLVTSDLIKRSIQHKAPVDEIREQARAGGMTTLLQDGIAKVLAGHTDLKQILAVCSR